MTVAAAISYILHTIWLIIPFRQIKTGYLLYFLIYAISSAFLLINENQHIINTIYFYLGVSSCLIVSLFNFKRIPHYIFFLTGVLIISIILPFLLSIKAIIFCLIVQHVIIFIIILKRTVVYISKQEKINIFYFVLLLYEITLVSRFIVVAGDIEAGIIFFYLTSAFGVLIGIFFLFYNEKNSPKFSLT